MTHYCMLGNQPQMELKKADDNKIDLVFVGGGNIDPAKSKHMHSLSISFIDKDHMVQEWTLFENGKEKEVTTLKFTRIS